MMAFFETFIRFQKRYYVWILLFGVLLSASTAWPAIRLLKSVATELIHLLPSHYPSVGLTDKMREKFKRRSNLFVIVSSQNPDVNETLVKDLKTYLENLKDADGKKIVDYAEIEKEGYDFVDKYKLVLLDLDDIYKIRDTLQERIEREKIGALYIDLESDETEEGGNIDTLIKDYQVKYTQGVQSRYRRNEEGTVYALDVYPASDDSGLKFFKSFGEIIQDHIEKYRDEKIRPKYGDAVEIGYAGAIKTRVDQYDAIMQDLAFGGAISMSSIFVVLYLYFTKLLRRQKPGLKGFLHISLLRAVPVVIVFVPMIFSTFIAFGFCSLFFDKLNIITSFLFAIIFGLGVDIGIHLMTRYIQDRALGMDLDRVHRDVLTRTGKTCATSVLTTVSSFYILVVNDFRGFSDFGWIAGNGLIIALICYLVFQPCLILLIDRFHLLGRGLFRSTIENGSRRRDVPFARGLLVTLAIFTVVTGFFVARLGFEWDFGKLNMKIAEREVQKERLKGTVGRVNTPAAYIFSSPVESREIGRILKERKAKDTGVSTIHFFRSYYDLISPEQDEKLAVIAEIGTLLDDDALNALDGDEKKLVDDMKKAVAETERVRPDDIPLKVRELFWGNTDDRATHVGYVFPLAHLELNNGRIAREYRHDVGEINAFGRTYNAVSDNIVFAEVLTTLFDDSRVAISLSAAMLVILVWLHYRDFRRTALVLSALGLGIFWMFGLMGVFGLKLNFYNMIIIPAMIGMGEDNSVHVIDRFEEFGRRSMLDVLRTSGGAAFMASITTILGYAGLCVARHPGLNSIGWMAIMGLVACLLSSLVFLPVVLQLFFGLSKVSAAKSK